MPPNSRPTKEIRASAAAARKEVLDQAGQTTPCSASGGGRGVEYKKVTCFETSKSRSQNRPLLHTISRSRNISLLYTTLGGGRSSERQVFRVQPSGARFTPARFAARARTELQGNLPRVGAPRGCTGSGARSLRTCSRLEVRFSEVWLFACVELTVRGFDQDLSVFVPASGRHLI